MFINLYLHILHVCNSEINNFAMYFKPNLESIHLKIPLVVFFLVGDKAFLFIGMFNEK